MQLSLLFSTGHTKSLHGSLRTASAKDWVSNGAAPCSGAADCPADGPADGPADTGQADQRLAVSFQLGRSSSDIVAS